jgi:hypothetical protein
VARSAARVKPDLGHYYLRKETKNGRCAVLVRLHRGRERGCTIDDHFFEVFAPDDDRGPDGKVHLEGETGFFCLCGTGGSVEKLDAHFAEVFTPADSAGPDGVIHKVAATRVQ